MAKIKVTEEVSRRTIGRGLISMLENMAKDLTPKFEGDLIVHGRGYIECATSGGSAYGLLDSGDPQITVKQPAYCIVEERRKDKGEPDLKKEDFDGDSPLMRLAASCIYEAIFRWFHQDETSSSREKRLKKEQQSKVNAEEIKLSRKKIFAVRKDFNFHPEACIYDLRVEQVVNQYLNQYAEKHNLSEVNVIKLI